jgi:hypothetical protein
MTIVILSWISLSTLFVLALLSAAARPMPRRGEEFAAQKETSERTPIPKRFSAPARMATSSPTA